MCEQIMLDWINDVWRKQPGAFFKPDALLIIDSMRSRLLDSVKTACKKSRADLAIIPGGLTKKVQPLDICVSKSFKSEMRILWEKWMSEGLHTYTNTGKMRKATFSEVARWVEESWKSVKKTTIISGFAKAGLIPESSTEAEGDDMDDPETKDEDPALDSSILKLFESESKESDFDGFDA